MIGAHLDHLGVDASGRVFNGADDNASGSSSLLMQRNAREQRMGAESTVVFT